MLGVPSAGEMGRHCPCDARVGGILMNGCVLEDGFGKCLSASVVLCSFWFILDPRVVKRVEWPAAWCLSTGLGTESERGGRSKHLYLL